MSIVLSAYSKSAFKEFVLPAVNNTEITLLLEHYVFQIQEDIALRLEVLDGEWHFQEIPERIHVGNVDYDGKTLENGDTYSLVTENSETLALMVQETESSFSVYSKFSLKGLEKISIGNQPDKNDCLFGLLRRGADCFGNPCGIDLSAGEVAFGG